MTKTFILGILLIYFVVLLIISYFTGKKANNNTFFTGNKDNKWYVVAFGMIGASLSGVTFISIPGTIEKSGFTYLQMSLGYIVGYAIIAFVLLPLYYRLNLTSIYEYLKERFGIFTYKMGAAFFILSRLIGASLRMYLVANVLQVFVFDEMNIPFFVTVSFSILLIWVYTFKGGIKTIVWTDTLQTLFMLISVGLSVYFIADELNLGLGEIYGKIDEAGMGDMWQTENVLAKNYWLKGLIGGMFLTLGMTGVDQDMMQKNMACKNIKEGQKNMVTFGVVLFFVNVVFVVLGGLLFLFINEKPEILSTWNERGADNDLLFASIALEGGLKMVIGIFFLLGLIAAAYSSADSALTSLTTSLSVDFLDIKNKPAKTQEFIRKIAHVIMSLMLLLTIVIFKFVKSDNVVWELFNAANYTYGPLLGLFMFGVLTKRKIDDIISFVVCITIAISVYIFMTFGEKYLYGYEFGSELLGINAILVFIVLFILSKKQNNLIHDKLT